MTLVRTYQFLVSSFLSLQQGFSQHVVPAETLLEQFRILIKSEIYTLLNSFKLLSRDVVSASRFTRAVGAVHALLTISDLFNILLRSMHIVNHTL